MLFLLQIGTVIFGIGTVFLSLLLAYKFYKSPSDLGLALAFMLVGEAFIGATTVFFALSSAMAVYNIMSPWEAMLLRWVIFFAAAGTSIHLFRTISSIQSRDT